MISRSWRSHVPYPLHQISWLEHIQCYQKSTLPLSEECALSMLHHRSIRLILRIGPLCWCLAYCPTSTALLLLVLLPMTLPLPLLHLYCNTLSKCCLMLPIALPLLTAALQLSYREVSHWPHPNTEILVSLEASWCWSHLCCYPLLRLLPLRCCNLLCASRTVVTSTALLQTSAL